MIAEVALAATVLSSATVSGCETHGRFSRLPDRFRMISSADLPGFEIFVLSDGACVCENTPGLQRKQGVSIPLDLKWACHVAGPDEQLNSDQDAH